MRKQTAPSDGSDVATPLETGLEALRSSPEFRGPAVLPDHEHDHANDHYALI